MQIRVISGRRRVSNFHPTVTRCAEKKVAKKAKRYQILVHCSWPKIKPNFSQA